MRERPHNLVIKVDADELAKVHALANAGDEHVARLVRRWIAQHYTATFGDAPPAPKRKTKHR